MSRVYDDLLKQIAKMIALESHETKPVIHININLDKCWQLFEDEGQIATERGTVAQKGGAGQWSMVNGQWSMINCD